MGGFFTIAIGGLRRALTPSSGVVRAAVRAPLLLLLATCQVDKLTKTPPPDATLALNGPGAHRPRVVRDGFEPFERAIRVASGQELRITDIVLRDLKP